MPRFKHILKKSSLEHVKTELGFKHAIKSTNEFIHRIIRDFDAIPAVDVWILADGTWNDNGIWIDTETWNDN